jgi:hypothetical protein
MFRALGVIDAMGWIFVLAFIGWLVVLFWLLGKMSVQDWANIVITILILEFLFLR